MLNSIGPAGTCLHYLFSRVPSPSLLSDLNLLLSHGVSVNTPDPRGLPPVVLALVSGHDAVASLLVQTDGCDVGYILTGGANLMHIAADCGCTETIGALNDKNQGLRNMENHEHELPLHLAAKNEDRKGCRKLLICVAALAKVPEELGIRDCPVAVGIHLMHQGFKVLVFHVEIISEEDFPQLILRD